MTESTVLKFSHVRREAKRDAADTSDRTSLFEEMLTDLHVFAKGWFYCMQIVLMHEIVTILLCNPRLGSYLLILSGHSALDKLCNARK